MDEARLCDQRPAPDPEPETLVDHIRWAESAKRYYVDFLKAAFSSEAQPLPRWVRTTCKRGRYAVASRALVQLVSDLPALVNPMILEPALAPPKNAIHPVGKRWL